MHGGEIFTTRDSSGIRNWPQSNAEKRGAVKDKLFPAFISRHSAARRGAARHSAACNVAPAMINNLSFFKRGAARRGAVWLGVP